ncbi:MAG: hypothetical protein D3916_05375 [Candidatus Electrothrix sp. MAN1_4]|nr:hypothetical protein [Candidatus Electrothrix sp. MAN1_4]
MFGDLNNGYFYPNPNSQNLNILLDQKSLTLQKALERVRSKHPSKVFIFHTKRYYTYAETDDLTNGFADFLISHSVRPGSRICLLLPRIPELVLAFLGGVKAGLVPVPVNYASGRQEVKNFLLRIEPAVIIVHKEYVGLLNVQLAEEQGIIIIVVGGRHTDLITWRDVCFPVRQPYAVNTQPHALAYLNLTTGSSGRPKGATATHANIYWNTRSAVENFNITSEDVHLCMFASFAHPHELFARALYTGGSLVMLEQITPKTIIKTIDTYAVSCMMGLAPMYATMALYASGRSSHLESLRFAESGGMYTRPDIARDFRKCFGVPILSVWGSTETTGIALANRIDNMREDGSMGQPCPHYQVRLVDEDGEEVKNYEVGELTFRGQGVVQGYDEELPCTNCDGWYYSGDMAWKDESGFFYFAERKSGLIKMAGLKVYPLQVENVLLSYPGVREAAVIGVPDKRKGMVPKAFLVLQEGSAFDADALTAYCRKQLAPYMLPKQIDIVDALPKIGSGKIDKKALTSQNVSRDSSIGMKG